MNGIITRCKSCRAEIIWLAHELTGKAAPIDWKPSEQGNIELDVAAKLYRVIAPVDLWDYRQQHPGMLHLNHFATCPQAKDWKGRKA